MKGYFDYNATTPIASEVKAAMEPYWTDDFGNPSSLHVFGRKAAKALRTAREQAASLLGIEDEKEIIFTSGGTESNNLAIRSALACNKGKNEIIISAVEHSSIYKLCVQLEKQEGYQIKKISVDTQGFLNLDQLRDSITEKTAIVSLMSANNETGIRLPIEKAGDLIKSKNVLFHVDAVQSVGKEAIHLGKSKFIDFLSLSAHKFYGPKGAGILFARNNAKLIPLIYGGSQERGRRAGTENVTGIVGMGRACELAKVTFTETVSHVGEIRDYFEAQTFSKIPNVGVNGSKTDRLCNTSNLRFQGVDGEALLMALDQKGIAASSGSACMSGSRTPSRVLTAMGLSEEEANSSLRFSFGRDTRKPDIDHCVQVLAQTVEFLRTLSFKEQHSH